MERGDIVYLDDRDFVYDIDLKNYISHIYGYTRGKCEKADIVVYIEGGKNIVLKDRCCIFNKKDNE